RVNPGLTTAINAGIAGTVGLTKTGGGTLTLGGPGTYSGSTAITGGMLRLAAANVLPSATAVAVTNATFDLTSFNQSIGGLAVGRLVLNAVNTYSGPTAVNTGTLVTGVANALPATTDLIVPGNNGSVGGVLEMSPAVTGLGVAAGSYDQTVASLSGGGRISLG